MSIRIGSVTLPNPVISAPMAGVTDKPFRILAKEAGCGLVCTEMISDMALVHNNQRTKEMLDLNGEITPISVQIFGSRPEVMADAASLVETAGADIIDINMGCPAPKICKNNEGCALMRNLPLAGEIIEAVVRRVKVPVTVKMRKGWDEDNIKAVELAQLAEEKGAAAVTVHGRTRGQFYSGQADWNIIRQVKETVKIPVIGNGDIWTASAAKRMREQTGCDGVMIGRASMGNPWIFREVVHFLATGEQLPPPGPKEKILTAIRHLNMLAEEKGDWVAVREMRKHASWYIKGLREAARVRDKLIHALTVREMRSVLEDYLNQFEIVYKIQKLRNP